MRKPNPLWFTAKRYGWGWTPATWQGWLILFIFVVLMLADFMRINTANAVTSDTIYLWIIDLVFLTILLSCICWLTGEKPRWRWGDKN